DDSVTTTFQDQFGTREVTVSKTGMVCAPASPPPTCTDGIQNGTEAGIDCGPGCSPCPTGGTPCTKDGECASTLCVGGFCADPDHCSNAIQDADETGINCGGSQ